MSLLSNAFAGKSGVDQPWKKYYKGIKPKNPLGGNIVRRMGNKIKPDVSRRIGGNQMTFSHTGNLALFKLSKEEFLAQQKEKEQEENSPEVPVMETVKGIRDSKRATRRDNLAQAREIRGRVNSARGISQEVRGWLAMLGV